MRARRVLIYGVAAIMGLPLLALLIAVTWIAVLDRPGGRLVVGDVEREYLLHVPESYDAGKPTPLVISLHAGATWPAHQRNLSHWDRLADQYGFIVVYPAGTPQLLGLARVWRTTPDRVLGDVAFLSKLIETLQSQYNIDAARIYVSGISNGGGMAFALACGESRMIAAVGLVAAAHELPFTWCTATRPLPVIAFHGSADTIVPFEGGPLGDPFNPVKPVYPPVREFMSEWAQRNRCASAHDSRIAADVVRTAHAGCADHAAVVLYTVEGGGHSWPGGKPPPQWRVGPTTMSIDATAEMWRFFEQHPRPSGVE